MNITTTITIDGHEYAAELGTIESVSLGFEDHGFLTGFIHLAFPGSGQGFGGVVLGGPNGQSCSFLTEKWVRGILRVTGTSDWNDVAGCRVYALRERSFGPILGLANTSGTASFFEAEVTDSARKQRADFNVQHEMRRVADDLERAAKKINDAGQTANYAVNRIREAIANIGETEPQP